MKNNTLHKWLDAWGYSDMPDALHLSGQPLLTSHPYHTEISALLDPSGDVKARAVFDVDGVPTVCFLDQANQSVVGDELLQLIRERAWNQNLVSIVLVVEDERAMAVPTSMPHATVETITFQQAKRFGEFSSADLLSGDIFSRHTGWFAPENRVDRVLLNNLEVIVHGLMEENLDKANAQLLMAQVMFVSYLEHRGIVGELYRQTHKVKTLFELVRDADHKGIVKLLERLKIDFNGDVLEPVGAKLVWSDLSSRALALLNDFLSRVDLRTGQRDLWHYDFRFIPVELISGIYESFLSEDKKAVGAYYTPRNLAMLAVEQAFHDSDDLLTETVYDGACGSGILLTTAFRRMLSHAESTSGRQWTLTERIELLKRSIFGSDLNKSACRVTAFSLYLSVLENLKPSDITKLTAQGKSKLPQLAGRNIISGDEGDFFSSRNSLATSQKFTIFLSNPPWVEPDATDILSADSWAKEAGHTIPRRQLCAAFMLRALESIDPLRGKLCFILPVSILAASTSQKFVKAWMDCCTPKVIINLGDLRKLLFDNAKQPTLLVVAKPRNQQIKSLHTEVFDYWTPKADVSFAFGRLTLHGADRHKISTQRLQSDNTILTNLYWGTEQDVALITRLEMRGQLNNVLTRDGWDTAKGFHKKDSHVKTADLVSVAPIQHLPYLDARHFSMHGPLLDDSILQSFPDDIHRVPNLSEHLISSFTGPRIVFKDGMSSDREVCAAFSASPFAFNSSTGVIIAPDHETDILRFLSVYLHSDLVRYLLLLSAYQVSFERERVTLRDIRNLPFVHPDKHLNTQQAFAIIKEISDWVKKLESSDPLDRSNLYDRWKPTAETLIADYFGLSPYESSRIQEVVAYVLPSVQPSSINGLLTPLQRRVSDHDLRAYTQTIIRELEAWRDADGGKGHFCATLTAGSAQLCGSLAVLRLDLVDNKKASSLKLTADDDAVAALIQYMREKDLLPLPLQGNFYLAADIIILYENSIYFVKPLVRRLWLQGQAVRDAEHLVRHVRQGV